MTAIFSQKEWDARVAFQEKKNKSSEELTKKILRDLNKEDLKKQIMLPLDGSCTWEDMQDQIFQATLTDCAGCRTWAAQRLNVALRTVRNRIKKLEDKGFIVPKRDTEAIQQIKSQNRKRSDDECRERLKKEGVL